MWLLTSLTNRDNLNKSFAIANEEGRNICINTGHQQTLSSTMNLSSLQKPKVCLQHVSATLNQGESTWPFEPRKPHILPFPGMARKDAVLSETMDISVLCYFKISILSLRDSCISFWLYLFPFLYHPFPQLHTTKFYILIHFLKISLIYILVSEVYVILGVWSSIEVC